MMRRREFLGSALTAASYGLARPVSVFAAGAAPHRLRLGFLTDLHTRIERGAPEALALAARAINECRCDLLIGGGDYITEGFESSAETVKPRWAAVRRFSDALSLPIHPAIGNHDYVQVCPADGSAPSSDPKGEFLRFFNLSETFRHEEQRGFHFIFLDALQRSDDSLLYHCTVPAEQLAWLESLLAAIGPTAPIILVTHMPLLTAFYQATAGSAEPPPVNRVITNNRQVLRLFERSNLLLVLQGHLHVNETIRWRNTTFVTGGAVCGKWWQGEWNGTTEGFGAVTIENGRIDWEYRGYGWHADQQT